MGGHLKIFDLYTYICLTCGYLYPKIILKYNFWEKSVTCQMKSKQTRTVKFTTSQHIYANKLGRTFILELAKVNPDS